MESSVKNKKLINVYYRTIQSNSIILVFMLKILLFNMLFIS